MVLSVVIYFKLLIQCVPFLMSNAQQLGGGLFRDNKLQFHKLHAVHAASIHSLAFARKPAVPPYATGALRRLQRQRANDRGRQRGASRGVSKVGDLTLVRKLGGD